MVPTKTTPFVPCFLEVKLRANFPRVKLVIVVTRQCPAGIEMLTFVLASTVPSGPVICTSRSSFVMLTYAFAVHRWALSFPLFIGNQQFPSSPR